MEHKRFITETVKTDRKAGRALPLREAHIRVPPQPTTARDVGTFSATEDDTRFLDVCVYDSVRETAVLHTP